MSVAFFIRRYFVSFMHNGAHRAHKYRICHNISKGSLYFYFALVIAVLMIEVVSLSAEQAEKGVHQMPATRRTHAQIGKLFLAMCLC